MAPASPLPRNIRQAEIIPQEDLNRVAAVIIGCGAIGSWLARFLAHMGVPYFLLVDPDVVSTENLALQGYAVDDLGMPKVEAMQRTIFGLHATAEIDYVLGTFRGEHLKMVPKSYDHLVVFSCVDDIDVREFLYRAVRKRCSLFIDGRMAALVWRVITVDYWPDYYYETTLFRSSEANVLRCTAKGTVCTAAAPALQMATQLMLWLKGARIGDENLMRDVEGNLLATTFEIRQPDGVPG
jgi:molybdopterin/thiamine biosynthesis adenylyltransferase